MMQKYSQTQLIFRYFISAISLSVILGKFKTKSGTFILFLFVNLPPCITSQTISFSTISFTLSSIVPSFINIVLPISMSLYNSLYVIETLSWFPIISSFSKVNVAPLFKYISSFSNLPILISGPCVSSNNGIGSPSSPLIHLNTFILSSWS